MNTQHNTLNYMCRIQGSELTIATQEIDLGVTVDRSLETLVQRAAVTKNAKKMLGM